MSSPENLRGLIDGRHTRLGLQEQLKDSETS